jgi:hypothetical protein
MIRTCFSRLKKDMDWNIFYESYFLSLFYRLDEVKVKERKKK